MKGSKEAMATPHRGNLFDLLRIAAACAVIVSHHFPITQTAPPAWLHASMVGGVAVMTFFAISGYLVTQSWLRQPEVLPFLYRRFLRIWPGLLLAVLSNIFLFGVLFTSLPATDFLAHPETVGYFRNLMLVKDYPNLPGVFEANPLPRLMNGPLWTIPMESLCYLALAGAGVLGLLASRRLACAAGMGYIAFFLVARNADLTGEMRHWFEYPAYFAYGALIAVFRKEFHACPGRLLLVLAPLAAFLFFGLRMEHSAGLLLLPPLLIFLGSLNIPTLARLQRGGDPSYGIYLYGCPVQQSVQALWPGLPFAQSLLLSIVLAVMAGYASWHLMESPALRLKRFIARTPASRPGP
ncbi:acyltransferase 3 [Paracidovorax citrulli AAC00-1]|uniref:Acyltransferase 3 n=3 Tax=Paracidovorax citrulli TaxID=80869 RepID=A1TUG4_PARC0|nr:acyltransferase 3 [Paracidovorax citrulli AAC00-1]